MDAAPPENDEQLEAVVSSANGADAAAFDHAGAVAALGGDVARAIGMLAERARSEARSEVEREELYKTAKTLGLAKYIELRLAVIAASVGERMPPPPDATPELVAELVRRRVALIMRMRRYYVTLGAILFRGFAAALKAAKRAAPAPAHGAATKKRVKESAVAHGGGAAAAPACAKKAKKAAGVDKVKTLVRAAASVGDVQADNGSEDDDGSDSETESESAPAAHAASTSGAAVAVKSRAAFSDLKGCVYAPAKAVIAVQASASSSVDLDDGVDLSNNYRFIYRPATGAWAKDGLTSSACPDSNQGNLIPRETGYVVGTARSPFGGDRLLVLGGASTTTEPRHIENTVYYSDDCGLTWRCYDGQQARIPRADQSHYRPGTNSLI